MPRNHSQSPASRSNLTLAALLTAFGIYAAAFIAKTSFVVDGVRYFVLQDDGMISMRYARNLASGHGLVWNAHGPPIEGFTNLLWVLIMALVHLLPISPPKTSLVVQIFSGLLVASTAVCACVLARRFCVSPGSGSEPSAIPSRAGLVAAAFTLFYYPFVNWSLQGSEVSAMALVATGATVLALRTLDTGRGVGRLYSVLAIGLLLRADGFVIYAAILGFMLFADAANRRKHLIVGAGLLVVIMAALTAWRIAYFGSPLPNTYYLKMTGYPPLARIATGLNKIGSLTVQSWLVPVLAVALSVPLLRDRRFQLIATVIATQSVYSAYVGGDAWEWWGGANRYICVIMPIAFAGIAVIVRHCYYAVSPKNPMLIAAGWSMAAGRRAVICAAALTFVGLDCAMMTWREPLLLAPPPEVDSNRRNVEYAYLVAQITSPTAKVAVTWAGTTPYFCDREYIDLLGKCDAHVAHTPMHLPGGALAYSRFYPGHMKWDYAYSIGKLKPDLILNVDNLKPDAAPYMSQYGVLPIPKSDMVIALRTASPNLAPL